MTRVDARPHTGEPVIVARALTKTYTFHQQGAGLLGALRSVVRRRYETRLAVDAIDFTVTAGEVVGLLGPNGAGKTTTLKMLAGLLHPTSGQLSVLGYQPARRDRAYLRRIALVMGQKSMLWWDVPAMDTLLLHKEMYGMSTVDFERSVSELAELLALTDLLGVQVRKLSLGERMRMELLAALLHRPDVLFLDEPTIGLDVVAKARVRGFLTDVNRQRGTTILVTSHDMDDIEALCSRVMVIDHDRVSYDGDLTGLVRATRPRKVVRATYAAPADTDGLAWFRDDVTVLPEASADDGATAGRVLRLEVARERLSELLETLPRLGLLVDLDVTDAPVEEIVRDLFAGATPSHDDSEDAREVAR